MAASSCKARMSKYAIPVMITSISGNQNMTGSFHVIELTKEWKKDEGTLIKIFVLSNFATIQQKSLIVPL